MLVQKTKPMAVGGIGMISTANCELPFLLDFLPYCLARLT